MVVVLKTNWKLVHLVVMAGFLLRNLHGQNTQQVSVVEEDERELLKTLQQTNFGFKVQTNIQEAEEEDQKDNQFSTSAISLLRADIEPSEKDLETQNFTQTAIPEQILQFADFIDRYETQQTEYGQTEDIIDAFETNLQLMEDTQNACQKDFQNFGRTSFNAVGIIRVTLLNGTEQYCTGTLIGDNTVITSAECYPLEKNAAGFQYQPSWVCDTVWLPLAAIYIPDTWIENKTNNIAIFFLQNPLYDAPRIGFNLGQLQTQQCYITLLGWIFSDSEEKQYKMVTCPNLPDIKEQLNIESENCGEISCNLDDMDFQTGSPIILTCPNPIKHTVIGVLHMREDKNVPKIDLNLLATPKKFAFPYMFNLEDYQDIKKRVETGVP